MKIYIDSEFKCHLTNDGTMREIETDFFDNRCDAFIEGYRYVPADEVWVREDGEKFTGTMISPWRDYSILAEFQAQYDKILTEAQEAYENGVNSI
jgi:hypothetical protein